MCDPSMALKAGEAGAGMVNAASAARGLRASFRAEERTQRLNAQLREIDAERTLFAGKVNADLLRAEGRGLSASQTAAFAANGIVVNEGVAAAVAASTQFVAERSAENVETEARWRALGLQSEARNAKLGAAAARAQARAVSPGLAALSSFVSSASSVLQSRLQPGNTRAGGAAGSLPSPRLPTFPRMPVAAPLFLPSGPVFAPGR